MEMSENLLYELEDSVFRGVDGFFAKYFHNLPYSSEPILSHDCYTSPAHLVTWLNDNVVRNRGQSVGRLICSQQNISNRAHSNATICISAAHREGVSDLSDVLIFGRLETRSAPLSIEDERKMVIALCQNAHDIFISQPNRLFLHGFLIYSGMIEFWIFDRCGAYSSVPIPIIQNPAMFVQTFQAYFNMVDKQFGLDSIIRKNDTGNFVLLSTDDGIDQFQLCVEGEPFVRPSYWLGGSGTTCFRARNVRSSAWNCVVKFVWRKVDEDGMQQESELLRLAEKRGVCGVARMLASQDITSISGLRSELVFPKKAFKLNGYDTETEIGRDVAEGRLKETRHTERILTCIAISPLGRSIDSFSTIKEFLTACLDVSKALRSLYQQGNMMHRDVCTNNVIIVDSTSGATGILIDLDVAWDMSTPIPDNSMCGSDGFMALGILAGDKHTYRHDVESLFYIVLWIAICHDGTSSKTIPEGSMLHDWMGDRFRMVFDKKVFAMEAGFKRLMKEVRPEFRELEGLLGKLHDIVFRPVNGRIDIGTDYEPEKVDELYDDFAGAIESFIN